MTEREILLKKISTYQFSILDLQIFLDTHPYDQQVLSQIKECKEKIDSIIGIATEKEKENGVISWEDRIAAYKRKMGEEIYS